MRSTVLFVLGVFAASVSAQTAVLPWWVGTAGGNYYSPYPWGTAGTGGPGLRVMCLYDSWHFTGIPAPINYPILITHVRWRSDDSTTATTWTGGTYSNATLALATAAVDYQAATTNWAANCSPDYTTVYSGPVTVLAGAGPGVGLPGPVVVDIALTSPFFYDPNLGDLVVDTNWVAGSWSGGTLPLMDVHTTLGFARRVYSNTLYPNANGIDANAPVIEIVFTPMGPGTTATNTTLGAGCTTAPDISSYQTFATSAAFDLANSSITLLRADAGYVALPGLTTWVPPSAAAQVLALGDESEVTVSLSQPMPVGSSSTTTQLTVCSNGYISAGPGNFISHTPSPALFLNTPRMWWGLCVHDYNPGITNGGRVKFEQVGTMAYVTWDGVWDAGSITPLSANSMQAQFDVTSGTVHFVYGTMSTSGNGRLVGLSDAGPSSDPGSMDISAALPNGYVALAFAMQPLTLSWVTRPILGTNWNLAVSRVPFAGIAGLEVLGVTDPGINDLSPLGMPTCGLRASLDVLSAWSVSGTSHAYSLAIPNDPTLVNFHVFTTAVVFQLDVNPFGAITANGIDGRIGNF